MSFMPFRSASRCHAIGGGGSPRVYLPPLFAPGHRGARVQEASPRDPFWLPDAVLCVGAMSRFETMPQPTLLIFDYEGRCECVCGGVTLRGL